jgi:hypothetical protein
MDSESENPEFDLDSETDYRFQPNNPKLKCSRYEEERTGLLTNEVHLEKYPKESEIFNEY